MNLVLILPTPHYSELFTCITHEVQNYNSQNTKKTKSIELVNTQNSLRNCNQNCTYNTNYNQENGKHTSITMGWFSDRKHKNQYICELELLVCTKVIIEGRHFQIHMYRQKYRDRRKATSTFTIYSRSNLKLHEMTLGRWTVRSATTAAKLLVYAVANS